MIVYTTIVVHDIYISYINVILLFSMILFIIFPNIFFLSQLNTQFSETAILILIYII